jgi:RNA polymerase sigma factor (sigma-70 family)
MLFGISDVTRILSQIDQGDPQAAEKLLPLVYDELRKLAAVKLAQEKPGQTLQATALVHEAYVRLVGGGKEPRTEEPNNQKGADRVQKTADRGRQGRDHPHPDPLPEGEGAGQRWDSRGHFFAAAAEAMRRILVEQARRRASLKRGGNVERIPLDDVAVAEPERPEELLELDEALHRLAEHDPQAAQLVKLRYFAGLPMDEVAEMLGISQRAAYYAWEYARSWLKQDIFRAESGH